ncbi:MAG: PEP-CTERM sorting domain-containing protein [Armatimonadetes bacterium]|nr:PEP-CTERM sorting domain-containing protein [Armatimonadota bacterium]
MKSNRILLVAFAAAFSHMAIAEVGFNAVNETLSALKDTSNLSFSSTNYRTGFHVANEAQLFINSTGITQGAGWDNDLSLDLQSQFGYYDFVSNSFQTYHLGDEITGDHDWTFDNTITHNGSVNPDVSEGVYDFSLDFYGGANSAATDLLGSVNYHIEVFNQLDITANGTATPNVLNGDDVAIIDMTVGNQMASRDFVSTTWFWFGNDFSSNLTGDFTGDWFDKHIAPGATRTDEHSRWKARANTPLGVYTTGVGVIGGLYNGDNHGLALQNSPTITVQSVPEPAALGAMVLGSILIIRKRRRA